MLVNRSTQPIHSTGPTPGADSRRMTLWKLLVGRSLGRSLTRGLAVGAALLLVSRFLLVPVRTQGISMMPTYDEGRYLLINRLAYLVSPARRGDIVAITLGSNRAVLVKRIVGLPGERLRIANGQVFVDDAPLAEPYVRYHVAWDVAETTIGADEVFVIGDNRSMPAGLHSFGSARRERILGSSLY